ncbi:MULTISPECIES: hypothetical protein [unclassified Frondihabitans]|uniref:hypothetical protein n=1 Tax=unclassified Frondihabitans TaxID=2626248 RepID=UPI000F5075F0|nr:MULTISPECIES: hypothetical protein [unclassified Frondihabitans]
MPFALAGAAFVLEQAPPARPSRLPERERRAILHEGSVTEGDLAAAEIAVQSGEFQQELILAFIVGLAASYMDATAAERLKVPVERLEDIYDDGKLIGRTNGDTTATPMWEFDADTSDGLLPHSKEIIAADAPMYYWSFGEAIYDPQAALRGVSPLSPARWLSERLEPQAVIDLLRGHEPSPQFFEANRE